MKPSPQGIPLRSWQGTNDGNAIINPDNNGTSGNPITYTNYGTDVVILRSITDIALNKAINLNKDYITIDGLTVDNIDQTQSKMTHFVILQANIDHCIVQNCTMEYSTTTAYEGVRINSGCTYNQILDNTIRYMGTNSNNGQGDGIKILGDATIQYNLISGNTVEYCGHSAIYCGGSYNVIKDNTVFNDWNKGLEAHSPTGSTLLYNLWEGNKSYECNSLNGLVYGPGMQITGCGHIIRRNRIYRSSGIGYSFHSDAVRDCKYVKLYHNVSYDNGQDGGDATQKSAVKFHETVDGTMDNIVVANNIFRENPQGDFYYQNFADSGVHTDTNNHKNADADPKFTDPDNGDFTIPGSSPCVGAAAWLTTITSASDTSDEFVVDDASYFCDGFGIQAGDEIQLEGTADPVGITDINYGTNTITVDEAVTWVQGDGVALEYEGSYR